MPSSNSLDAVLDAAIVDGMTLDEKGGRIVVNGHHHRCKIHQNALEPFNGPEAVRRWRQLYPALLQVPEGFEFPPIEDLDGESPSASSGLPIVSATVLLDRHPNHREAIIDGLLRRGETMNVIAAPKVGKSWLVHGMASAISKGAEWLGFPTTLGRVLVVDAELHAETLASRLRRVLEVTNGDPSMVDVLALRGCQMDVLRLTGQIASAVACGVYDVIVLDALYRLIPAGTSESDNAQMMHVYNTVDALARQTGASVVIIHHTTKGDQSSKGVTDVGSGAGAISRAADTHLVLREHELESCAVLEAVTRSFPAPNAQTIRFEFPVWLPSMIEPEVKGRKNGQEAKQQRTDTETTERLVTLLSPTKAVTISRLRNLTGFGDGRVRRGMMLLGEQVILRRMKSRNGSKRTDGWRLTDANL